MVVPGVSATAGKAVGKAVSSHAVVPGVRAAAGKAGSSQSSLVKAVSSQSSLGLHIFASHWSIATGFVFDDGARVVFFAFIGSESRFFCAYRQRACDLLCTAHRILGIEQVPKQARPGPAVVCEA